jgi:hypothetical protein
MMIQNERGEIDERKKPQSFLLFLQEKPSGNFRIHSESERLRG